jgi:hypothetical protein
MNDAHQTPLEEAISFLAIAAILVGVGCYAAAVKNIPVASPALFWVASIVYHWIPALKAIRAPQMPMLVSAAAVGGTFFVVGIPFAGLLATWFSSAQIANLERQTAKLQRNRARIQKQRRDRDRYDAR